MSLLGASHAFTMIAYDGEPCGMFGVQPTENPTCGLIWLVATPRIEERRNTITFLRAVPKWLDRIHETYDGLHNIIDSRNELHVRWIQWCGFKLIRSVWIEDVEFYEFAKVK